jgi:hypothetical protein
LFVVSVLLDAGAGDRWAFTSKSGERVTRSEGLAVGSLEFYEQGGFSGVAGKPLEVNCGCPSRGLLINGQELTVS